MVDHWGGFSVLTDFISHAISYLKQQKQGGFYSNNYFRKKKTALEDHPKVWLKDLQLHLPKLKTGCGNIQHPSVKVSF